LLNEAIEISKNADVIVAALGESAEFSGESSSRTNLDIPDVQKHLLMELSRLGKPIVLLVFNGRPLTLSWENEHIPAILDVWFPGSEAGDAIADVIFGKVNPSGKLSMTFPQNVGQIPIYYNHKNTGRPLPDGQWFQKFRSNYLDVSNDPLYPFGYGLSYSTFVYGTMRTSSTNLKGNQGLTVSVDVSNKSNATGKEVVQLYIRDVVGSVTRPVKELKGFQKVEIPANQTKTVSFVITTEDLKFYNYDLKYDWEGGDFDILIGTNSNDVQKVRVNWQK
ncbi:MAG TPA: glycoside hydrolase family 3 C-terminal domain-containing protein, partial [Saprospiraceae bacterium]|nr:glycoside hydrolase family 3 C-terminal domain-containing protein [Saprospiraceae bacterium]